MIPFVGTLQSFIGKRLAQRHLLQKVISNISWLFFDKILRMGVGLFVGAWVARYLGPEQFGLWNYAIALTSLLSAFATLGLDSIVVRDIVREPDKKDEILGSAFVLKLLGSIFTVILSLALVSFINRGETLTFWLVFISSAGFIVQSFNVIDFYFQSKILSKYIVISANTAFLIMAVAKIGLILLKVPLLAFAIAGLIEICLTSLFFVIAYRYNRENIFRWQCDFTIAKELLKNSWPLMLSGIAIMIYMRIDQVMIGKMLGEREVGLYSAAVKISEIWYFIPMVIVNSVFPAIIEIKKKSEELYYARLQKLFTFMAWLGISIAVIMTFASGFVIRTLFGKAYLEATSVLAIHIWAGVFVCLGVASGIWITTENLQKFSFYRTVIGAFANVIINLILIPIYGIQGAALSTVISQGISVFSIAFFKKGRQIAVKMLKSFVFE